MSNRLIGYQSGQGFLYDLSGASKMLFYLGFQLLVWLPMIRFVLAMEPIFDLSL